MNTEKNLPNTETAVRPDYESEIIAIIRGNDTPKILESKLENYHEKDISDILPMLTLAERQKLYRICPAWMLSAILEYSDEDQAGLFINEMDIKKAAEVLEKSETDSAIAILRETPKERRALLIDALEPEVRGEMRLIASFDEDEIGSRTTTNCIIIHKDLTVKQAMSELILQAKENDNISTIFVVDECEFFYGVIDLKDLLISDEDESLENLIITSFPYVYAHETVDCCLEKLKDYSESSIPVLDNSSKLLGVITARSVIEAVDDEMGEDYARLAGLTAEEDLKEPLMLSMKKRLPWLLVLLGLGLIVSGVVGAFEDVVSQLTLIMAFQSLILDMAGNVGTQSLAVTIRVLTDENLSARKRLALVWKEMRIAISNGAVLGILSFFAVGLYIFLIKKREMFFAFSVSGCIGFSLMIAMVVSGAVGTLVPLFLKRIKIDPAVASGPLITTVNDLVAVVTYYGLSWLLLIKVFGFAD